MSIFSSQSSWTGACSGASQSPINLSQSISKPCNLSCELVFDDGQATTASVLISDEGMILNGNLGSCKFRGESYSCNFLLLNHPSHHTLEGVQADGEVIAFFRKPTGETVCVSSLFRVSSSETPSLSMFKQFVPYAQTSGPQNVMFNGWSLSNMVPPAGSYYVYDGSSVIPPCMTTEWVVFKSMINIDPTDFAFLVRNVGAGSRSVQALGNREIFYNDVQSLPGGPMPHDNKTYMRCRPTGKKIDKHKPVQKIDLKTGEAKDLAKQKEESSKNKGLLSGVSDYVAENGWVLLFENLLFILATALGVWLGYTYGSKNLFGFYVGIANFAKRMRGVLVP